MPRLKDHSLAKKEPKPNKRNPGPRGGWTNPSAHGAHHPTLYTEALGEEICRRLMGRESLLAICKTEGMPAHSTILSWSVKESHPFAEKYKQARIIGYLALAEELLEIADDGSNDYIEHAKENGVQVVVDHDHIARSRLRVETRKWVLAKMLPKVYGEKLQLQGDEKAPIQVNHAVSWMTEDEAKARGWA